MASIPRATELASLSVSDRLDLMDELWGRLAADGNRGRTADEIFAELKRRL